MSFSTLGLADGLLRAVADEGYSTATPIQAQAIPVILSGRDLLAAAQTGTGKTAAFVLPILQKLSAQPAQGHRVVRALVLVPTRELAAQVAESVRNYGRHTELKSAVVFGGVNINPQIDQLRRGVDIVIATPGRLLDHMQQRTVDLRHLQILVLDEADRMLDMGFIHDIRRVIGALPRERQNLMFSATFSDDIRKLAHGILRDPATVEVAPRNATVDLIDQQVYQVDKSRKLALLAHLITTEDWEQVLVFCRTKHGANRLAQQLEKRGIVCAAIHGNKSQGARTRALADFKANRIRVLVATDIAARGLDIDQLPHVVNFELPNVPEDYVHRIGRTGRAGASGEAVSLVSPDEKNELRAIQNLIKRTLPSTVIAGFEPGTGQPQQQNQHHQHRQSQGQHRQQQHGRPSWPGKHQGGGWRGGGGKAHKSAEHLLGKSRKVH
ncbi:MAG TPA: DEAD/DEAH box helicase [Nevskiaceae bacterium]|nr:DEAD/DEAH box helicase [Nevskiaceae bacterium]